jgi:hypothetical protein
VNAVLIPPFTPTEEDMVRDEALAGQLATCRQFVVVCRGLGLLAGGVVSTKRPPRRHPVSVQTVPKGVKSRRCSLRPRGATLKRC